MAFCFVTENASCYSGRIMPMSAYLSNKTVILHSSKSGNKSVISICLLNEKG